MDSDGPRNLVSVDDQEGSEIVVIDDTRSSSNSPLPVSPGLSLSTQRDNTYAIDNLKEERHTIKWMKAAIVMAFSALLALLSISFIVSDGKLRPEYLFREHPASFMMFLMAIMVAFFSAVNGIIFIEEFPNVGRACNLMALVGVILSFTVLLWGLLPPNLGWLPWAFFGFTSGALFYTCGMHGMHV